MNFIKYNSLKSDTLFNLIIIQCFSGSRFFKVQGFKAPGFSESRFFRVQVFQGPVFQVSGPGSRPWVQVQVLEAA